MICNTIIQTLCIQKVMKDVNNVLFICALFHDIENTSDYLGSNGRMISELRLTNHVERTLMCIVQALDCDVTANGRSIFALNCPCLHLCMPVLSLSSLKSYI